MIRWLYNMWNDRRLRYLVVGGVNTLFGYLSSLFLYYTLCNVWHIVFISMLASIINISFSFLTHKTFVFRTKGNWLREYMRCYVVYGVGILISLMLIWLLVDVFGVPFWLAQAILTGVMVVFSYLGHSRFSFATKQAETI